MTKDIRDGSFDAAVDRAHRQVMWAVGAFLWFIAIGLLFFAFSARAQAAPLPDPTVVPDYSYPSGTPTTYTCDSSSDYLTLFREDTGLATEGAVTCSGVSTPHSVGYWFGPGTAGPADGDGNYILVETTAFNSGACATSPTGTDIDACRLDSHYVSEFSPFCMGSCDGGGGGGGGDEGSTTATSTVQTVDNPVANMQGVIIILLMSIALTLYMFRRKTL